MEISNGVKKIFFLILMLLILGGIFIWQGTYLPRSEFTLLWGLPKSIGVGKSITFTVEEGQGSKEIAHNLQREGLIRWALIFRAYVMLKGVAGKLQAGEYILSSAMSIPEIVKKIVSGDVLKQQITIIEGWNLRDIGTYFEKAGVCSEEELFETVSKDFSDEFDFLADKPKNLGLEGYLFPDTYKIRKGESLEGIVRKMLNNFDKKLTPDLKEEIKRQGKTIFEIVTMASILEKEVRTLEDKEIVSGIFWKRIKERLPLQSCATIAYIKGVNQWQYSYEDTRIKSPYNTYLNLGLTLGPISNPGIDSIEAAIFPKKTDYNYFLTDPATEKTIFSKTYEEHNINKAKYFK